MENSSLIEILKTFSKDEILRFDNFVDSPYFNRKEAVSRFWGVLKEYFPGFNSPELTRESIYCKIFPGKEYNYGTFKNLVFDLTKLAEKFLSIEKMFSDDLQASILLLTQYKDKSLGKLFEQKFKNIEKSITEIDSYSDRYRRLIDLMEIRILYTFFQTPYKLTSDIFLKKSEYQVYYFLDQLLESYSNVLTSKDRLADSNDNSLLAKVLKRIDFEKVLAEIEKIDIEKYKLSFIAYKKYLSLANPDRPEYYFEYKQSVIDNFGHLSTGDKYNNFNSMLTALMLLDYDVKLKTSEYNELNKFRVSSGMVLNSDGSLSPAIYAGIITNAAWMKDSKFIEEVVGLYHSRLPAEYRENMKIFCRAYLAYANNDFEKALEYSSKIDYDMFSFNLYIKNLQIVLYYELDNLEGFLYHKDAYKHYLLYNKAVSKDKEPFIKLIKYVENMFNIRESRSAGELEILKKEILNDNEVRMKNWLVEKITELEKK